jgi:hypothetical protein
MSANWFETRGYGETAKEAFDEAVVAVIDEILTYSGGIAGKSEFTQIEVPSGQDPEAFVRELYENADPRVDDKWGPAGCIRLKDGEWLFFGWAAS